MPPIGAPHKFSSPPDRHTNLSKATDKDGAKGKGRGLRGDMNETEGAMDPWNKDEFQYVGMNPIVPQIFINGVRTSSESGNHSFESPLKQKSKVC